MSAYAGHCNNFYDKNSLHSLNQVAVVAGCIAVNQLVAFYFSVVSGKKIMIVLPTYHILTEVYIS